MPRKYAACSLGLRNLNVYDALRTIAELGFDGVDLWQISPHYGGEGHIGDEMPVKARKEIKGLAASLGLEIVALASYPGADFSSGDQQKIEAELKWAERTVDLAKEMNAPVIRMLPGRGEGREVAQAVAPHLAKAVKYAESQGIKVVLETHGGLTTADVENFSIFFQTVNSPALGILYDPANLCHAGRDYKAILERYPDRIYHVHLKNVKLVERSGGKKYEPCGPKAGLVNVPWVIRTLEKNGYTGAIAIEYEAGGDLRQRKEGLKEWLDAVRRIA